MNWTEEIKQEYQESKDAEQRGILHPRKYIQYTSRIHQLRENRELIIFFAAVITGYALMAGLVIQAVFNGLL